MDNEPEEIIITAETFREYASLLWHWAWLLILATALAGVSAYIVSKYQQPVYQASTTLLIDEAPAARSADYTSILTSERLARTYTQLLTQQPMLDAVAERLALQPLAAEDWANKVEVQLVRDTQLIDIKVEDTDPELAAQIANTIVVVFREQNQALQAARYEASLQNIAQQMALVNEQTRRMNAQLEALGNPPSDPLERDRLQAELSQSQRTYSELLQSYEQIRLAAAQGTSNMVQVEPATAPESPIRPRVLTNTLLAAVVGLMLGVGTIFLIEFLGDTIRDPQEITRKWGVPVLGTIIRYKHNKDELITAKQPRSPITEAFRALRTNLQFASIDLPIHTLLVTSPSPEDGKTTVAANLGSVIAQGGRKVVIVDADLRQPRIHKILQVPNRVGLTDQFIRPQDHINGAVKQTEIGGLHALTSGNLPPNPSELLGSERMSEILRQLARQFDTIILDASPILVVTDALVLAPRVDGVLVVIKPSVTKRAALKHTLEQLRQVKANVIGVVLNDIKIDRSHSYNYQGYYYSQKYAKGYHVTEPSEESEVTSVGGSRKPALLRDKKNTQEEN